MASNFIYRKIIIIRKKYQTIYKYNKIIFLQTAIGIYLRLYGKMIDIYQIYYKFYYIINYFQSFFYL